MLLQIPDILSRLKRGHEYPHVPRASLAPKALYVYPLQHQACRWLREGTRGDE